MLGPTLREVCRLAEALRLEGTSDAELLRRFLADRDEAAFHGILHRHGPMVLGVCRAVLRDAAKVEDAFQATFLALARDPGAIRAALGSWLHGVAYRTALKARAADARRRERAVGAERRPAAPAVRRDPEPQLLSARPPTCEDRE